MRSGPSVIWSVASPEINQGAGGGEFSRDGTGCSFPCPLSHMPWTLLAGLRVAGALGSGICLGTGWGSRGTRGERPLPWSEGLASPPSGLLSLGLCQGHVGGREGLELSMTSERVGPLGGGWEG